MIAPSHLPLHHTVLGPDDAPPILYVHGLTLSGAMWRDVATRVHTTLRPGRYRHVLPDLRGMGASPCPSTPPEDSTVADFVDDLAHLLAHLEVERPVVYVGLSYGTVLAFEFFRRYRASLRALVLADGRAEGDTPEGAHTRRRQAADVLARGTTIATEPLCAACFHPDSPAPLKATWRAIMDATPREGCAAALYAIAARPDSRPTLRIIDVPTLVVCGDHDEITTPALMREIHESIAGSRMAMVPHAGHLPPVENPAAFAETLVAFLDAL